MEADNQQQARQEDLALDPLTVVRRGQGECGFAHHQLHCGH